MPSRRRLLARGSVAIASLAGAAVASRHLSGRVPSAIATPRSAEPVNTVNWPMARYDPAGTGFNPHASGPTDDVSVAWERSFDGFRYGTHAPALVGDRLYVIGRDSVLALDRETGETRFSRRGAYRSPAASVEASAYRTATLAVAGSQGLYGLNAGGGYELFGRSVGLERWHAPGQAPPREHGAHDAQPPVTDDGTVYAIVPETDRVAAFDANSGRVRWERTIGDPRSSGSHRPAIRDGTVYVSSAAGNVEAIDADTGEREWAVRLERDDGPGIRNLRPLTATERGLVVPSRSAVSLLDPDDGDVLWEYVHDGNVTRGSAAVADGVAFVTDGDGSFHAIALDGDDAGEPRWTADYGLQTDPVVADGVVYLGYGSIGELVAIDAESGQQRWTYESGPGFSQPIVGDGVLYAVGHDRVLALEAAR